MKKRFIYLLAILIVVAAAWNANLIINLLKPKIVSISHKNNRAIPPEITINNNTFVYPSLGITAPLKELDNTNPFNIADWGSIRGALKEGTALTYLSPTFPETPLAFVTGHSSDVYPHGYSSIFAALGQAQINDQFVVAIDSSRYTFTVADKKVLSPRDLRGFANLKPTDSHIQRVALVTCWPLYTTKNRLIVVGERSI